MARAPFGVSANNHARLAVANGLMFASHKLFELCNYYHNSNNSAERKAKSYVMGRKNFLFHDTVDGARASAIVLSLIETTKANQLNIFQYLYTLLLYMPDYKNEFAGIEQLMPWSEFIRERCTGVMDTETETPTNRGSIPT